MDNNVFCRVVDSVKYLLGVVSFTESTGRAGGDTLTAGDTCNVVKVLIECGTDNGVKTAVVSADNCCLSVASGYTATAEDTFRVVTNKVSS